MQQPPPMTNIPPPLLQQNITTEQIQKMLDENKKLILAILENQNLGKFAECAVYQAHLQKNLMYLAAIADAQPPPAPTVPSQMPPNSAMQQGHNMQHPQAATAQQQIGGFPPKLPFQYNALRPQDQQQQQQLLQFQQQQPSQGHVGMRPSTLSAMHQAMQTGPGTSGKMVDSRGRKQDGWEAGSADGHGQSGFGHGCGD